MPILLEFSGQYLLYWDAPPSTIRRGEVSLVVERQRNLLATYSLCGDVLECYSPFFTSSFGGRPGTELARTNLPGSTLQNSQLLPAASDAPIDVNKLPRRYFGLRMRV